MFTKKSLDLILLASLNSFKQNHDLSRINKKLVKMCVASRLLRLNPLSSAFQFDDLIFDVFDLFLQGLHILEEMLNCVL